MKAWEPSCHGRCLSPTVARAGSGWRGVLACARTVHTLQTTVRYDTTSEMSWNVMFWRFSKFFWQSRSKIRYNELQMNGNLGSVDLVTEDGRRIAMTAGDATFASPGSVKEKAKVERVAQRNWRRKSGGSEDSAVFKSQLVLRGELLL